MISDDSKLRLVKEFVQAFDYPLDSFHLCIRISLFSLNEVLEMQITGCPLCSRTTPLPVGIRDGNIVIQGYHDTSIVPGLLFR